MRSRVATDRSRGRVRRLRRALAVILTNAVKLGRDIGFTESGRAALDPWFFDKLPGGLPLTAEGASQATHPPTAGICLRRVDRPFARLLAIGYWLFTRPIDEAMARALGVFAGSIFYR